MWWVREGVAWQCGDVVLGLGEAVGLLSGLPSLGDVVGVWRGVSGGLRCSRE